MASGPWPHLSVVRTGFAIHLMEPHLSKGEGLRVLFDRMGWSVEDALCVGDAPNDLPMFELAAMVGGRWRCVRCRDRGRQRSIAASTRCDVSTAGRCHS